jgi:hypothetical protein
LGTGRLNADADALRAIVVEVAIMIAQVFPARPSGAIKSTTTSVLEKRISWAGWHEKSVRHGQRAASWHGRLF